MSAVPTMNPGAVAACENCQIFQWSRDNSQIFVSGSDRITRIDLASGSRHPAVAASTGFGSATVTGMFLAELFETTGNIWMTTIQR